MRKAFAVLAPLLVVAFLAVRVGLKLGWFGPNTPDDVCRDLITALNQMSDFIDTLQTPADAQAKAGRARDLNQRVLEQSQKFESLPDDQKVRIDRATLEKLRVATGRFREALGKFRKLLEDLPGRKREPPKAPGPPRP